MKLHELFETTGKSFRDVYGDELGEEPDQYNGSLSCNKMLLTSLEGCPRKIMGDFSCFSNNLTSLKGGPEYVDDIFTCTHNKIETLEGVPSYIGNDAYFNNNKLMSLHNIHKLIKTFKGSFISFADNPIKSHVLGLLLIDGLYGVILDNREVSDIIDKHLEPGMRDVFACQEELIEAGYEEFAQL